MSKNWARARYAIYAMFSFIVAVIALFIVALAWGTAWGVASQVAALCGSVSGLMASSFNLRRRKRRPIPRRVACANCRSGTPATNSPDRTSIQSESEASG
jgi:hypothetical protein